MIEYNIKVGDAEFTIKPDRELSDDELNQIVSQYAESTPEAAPKPRTDRPFSTGTFELPGDAEAAKADAVAKGEGVRSLVEARRKSARSQVSEVMARTPGSPLGKKVASLLAEVPIRMAINPRTAGADGREASLPGKVLGGLSDVWTGTAGMFKEEVADPIREFFQPGYQAQEALAKYEAGKAAAEQGVGERLKQTTKGALQTFKEAATDWKKAGALGGEIAYGLVSDPITTIATGAAGKALLPLQAGNKLRTAARVGLETGVNLGASAAQSGGDVDLVTSLGFAPLQLPGLIKEYKGLKNTVEYIPPEALEKEARTAEVAQVQSAAQSELSKAENVLALESSMGAPSRAAIEKVVALRKTLGLSTDELKERLRTQKQVEKRGPVVQRGGEAQAPLVPEVKAPPDPRVETAKANLGKTVEKAEAAVTIDEQDITQAPEGLSIKEAQKALANPNEAAEKAATEVKSASENLRTVEQTVAKEQPTGEDLTPPPEIERLPEEARTSEPVMLWSDDPTPVKVGKLSDVNVVYLDQMAREYAPDLYQTNPEAAKTALARKVGLNEIRNDADIDYIESKREGMRLSANPVDGLMRIAPQMMRDGMREVLALPTIMGDMKGPRTYWRKMDSIPGGKEVRVHLDQYLARRRADLTQAEQAVLGINKIVGSNRKLNDLVFRALSGERVKVPTTLLEKVKAARGLMRQALDEFGAEREKRGMKNIPGYVPRDVLHEKLAEIPVPDANTAPNLEWIRLESHWVDALSKEFQGLTGNAPSQKAIEAFKEDFKDYMVSQSSGAGGVLDEIGGSETPLWKKLDEVRDPSPAFRSAFSKKRRFEDPPLPEEYYERNPAKLLSNYVNSMTREFAEQDIFGPGTQGRADLETFLGSMDQNTAGDWKRVLRGELAGTVFDREPLSAADRAVGNTMEAVQRTGRAVLLGAPNPLASVANVLYGGASVPMQSGVRGSVGGMVKAIIPAVDILARKLGRMAGAKFELTGPEAAGVVNSKILQAAIAGSDDIGPQSAISRAAKAIESGVNSTIAVAQLYVDLWGYYAGKINFDRLMDQARSGDLKTRSKALVRLKEAFTPEQIKEGLAGRNLDWMSNQYGMSSMFKSSGTGRSIGSSALNSTRFARRAFTGMTTIPLEQAGYFREVALKDPARFWKATAMGAAMYGLSMYAIANLATKSEILQAVLGKDQSEAEQMKAEIGGMNPFQNEQGEIAFDPKNFAMNSAELAAKVGSVPILDRTLIAAVQAEMANRPRIAEWSPGLGANLAQQFFMGKNGKSVVTALGHGEIPLAAYNALMLPRLQRAAEAVIPSLPGEVAAAKQRIAEQKGEPLNPEAAKASALARERR